MFVMWLFGLSFLEQHSDYTAQFAQGAPVYSYFTSIIVNSTSFSSKNALILQ